MFSGNPLRRLEGCTPTFLFSNGYNIPVIGVGTWNLQRKTVEVVKNALDVGYRHFDCAHVYCNEAEVGKALATAMDDKIIEREDIFVTSKLWNTFHHTHSVRKACKISLNNLRLQYLDNYLMHWPMAYKDGEELYPRDAYGKIDFDSTDYIQTWQAMEELVKEGLCRNIGLSNFNIYQIERILQIASIVPTNLQIECHPYLNQQKLIDFCKKHHIIITAYSTFGSPNVYNEKSSDFSILKNHLIRNISKKYNKTPAQILLRYQLQRGNVVVPKTTDKAHLIENLSIFDFHLSTADISALNSMDIGARFMTMNDVKGHPFYPFQKITFKTYGYPRGFKNSVSFKTNLR